MNELIHIAIVKLAQFLSSNQSPRPIASDWWQNHVVDSLSDQQQRLRESRYTKPQQLDLAALLRVLYSSFMLSPITIRTIYNNNLLPMRFVHTLRGFRAVARLPISQ
ncbi:hypothetical protein [Candidatus Spongiihabitans sp.]|uniref:hypothetical protein n=1 Tax=Candidatus Spongiihabitans sp. TaxID=3101308 RepID=UPI003C70164B